MARQRPPEGGPHTARSHRTAPHNLDAERALLGAMLLYRDVIAETAEMVEPDAFYSAGHGHIYNAIIAVNAPDPVLVVAELERAGLLDAAGGKAKVTTELPAAGADRSNARIHAGVVAKLARFRKLQAAGLELADAAESLDEVRIEQAREALARVATPVTRRSACSVAVADVEAERIEWIWPGRIPVGKLVMVDGNPGVAKSTVMTDVAACVSTGSPMPDGHRPAGPRDVVLLSAEDGVADTIRPRLEAAGADLSRVHVLTEVDPGNGEPPHPPSIPGDLDVIEDVIVRTNAALLVIDVLTAYLAAGVDSYRDADVRRALHPLAMMAARTGCAVVCIRHLSKSGPAKAIYRGGGSIAITGAARVAMIAGLDPDDESRRILAVSKCNVGPVADALAYRLVSDDEHGCARIQWEGTVEHTADDLVRDPAPADEEGEVSTASAWLTKLLEDGPVPVQDIKKAAKDAGLSWATIRRARKELRLPKPEHVGKPGDAEQFWTWALSKGGE